MKLIEQNLVDLSDYNNQDRLGHVSEYELSNGNKYFVYFLEMRFFGFKEIDKSGKIVKEESAEDHHYSLDIMFNDRSRYLGWNDIL